MGCWLSVCLCGISWFCPCCSCVFGWFCLLCKSTHTSAHETSPHLERGCSSFFSQGELKFRLLCLSFLSILLKSVIEKWSVTGLFFSKIFDELLVNVWLTLVSWRCTAASFLNVFQYCRVLLYSVLSTGPGVHSVVRCFGSAHSLQVLPAGLQSFHEWQHRAQVSYTHPHVTQRDFFLMQHKKIICYIKKLN